MRIESKNPKLKFVLIQIWLNIKKELLENKPFQIIQKVNTSCRIKN